MQDMISNQVIQVMCVHVAHMECIGTRNTIHCEYFNSLTIHSSPSKPEVMGSRVTSNFNFWKTGSFKKMGSLKKPTPFHKIIIQISWYIRSSKARLTLDNCILNLFLNMANKSKPLKLN